MSSSLYMIFSWCVVNIVLLNGQLANVLQSDDECIPDNELFICITLNKLQQISWLRTVSSLITIEIYSTAYNSSLSPIYTTKSYDISNNNPDMDVSFCFYPNYDILPNNISLEFKIINSTNNDNTYIASYFLSNIYSINITNNTLPIQLTEEINIISDIYNYTDINTLPDIKYKIWLSTAQCIEITSSIMYFANDYYLNIIMYRMDSLINITTFQTSKSSFNSIFCLPGYPTKDNSNQMLIGADFVLYDDTTNKVYNLSKMNDKTEFKMNEYQYESSNNLTKYDINKLHFSIGNIFMNYWQSCSHITIPTTTNEYHVEYQFTIQYDKLSEEYMIYTFVLLGIIVILLLLCSCIGCYSSKVYQSNDPIHYSNIFWCILQMWDFFSQVLFSIFIIYQTVELQYSDIEDVDILITLFIICIVTLIISYLCNLMYLIHYLQIWNDPNSPGVTRHWLELWAWFIIFIAMTMGGVHVALELCNSIIIPADVFCMHLSHSELIRTRKDRFVISCIQDISILLVIIIYIIFFYPNNPTDGDITLFTDIKYIVILNALAATAISFLSISIFRFNRRNYSHDNPVAQYRFSFTLKVNQKAIDWQSHWIHSHKRIQTCLQHTFDLRKKSLTIIDQCSESLNSMKIEGRLLRDDKKKSEIVEKMASDHVPMSEMKKIGSTLLQEFKKQFKLYTDDPSDISLLNLIIKPIIGGEMVYDHATCVQILCIGLKNCCLRICATCCPSYVQQPHSKLGKSTAFSKGSIDVWNVGNNNKQKELNINTSGITKTMSEPVATLPRAPPPPPPKQMKLALDTDNQTNRDNLPVISVAAAAPGLNEDKKKINKKSLSYTPDDWNKVKNKPKHRENNYTLDPQTLFADVYKNVGSYSSNNGDGLNSPTSVDKLNDFGTAKDDYSATYNAIKARNRQSTDQYGYAKNSSVAFKSADQRVKEMAGDAPMTLSSTFESNNSPLKQAIEEDVDLYDDGSSASIEI